MYDRGARGRGARQDAGPPGEEGGHGGEDGQHQGQQHANGKYNVNMSDFSLFFFPLDVPVSFDGRTVSINLLSKHLHTY